jgi:uncharacterized protein (DUF302 family)
MTELSYKLESKKTVDQLTEELEKESIENQFRVLAVHDVQATLEEKGFNRDPLKIIEVCNAGFAYEALKKDIDVSMFMPCKFTVYAEQDKTVLNLIRPTIISKMLPEAQLEQLAEEVERRLKKIMEAVV